jgi:hypothetical protein
MNEHPETHNSEAVRAPDDLRAVGRREFFTRSGFNLGAIAAASLFCRDGRAESANSGFASLAHFRPRAQNVIFLNMTGAPPQLDMFDHKPQLKKLHGEIVPPSFTRGERFAFVKGDARLLGSPFKFERFGRAGMWMSEVVSPDFSAIADDICMIKSVYTEQFNHSAAALLLFTGAPRAGRPSMGAWLNYGLGCESDELPGFVVLSSGRGARCGVDCYSAGFLPSVHQGVLLRSTGEPVLYLNNPPGVDRQTRRESLDALRALNQSEFNALGSPEIQTRIKQYELAFRMQSSVPELGDISSEPRAVHELYGTQPGTRHFSNNCLLARRLVERGVRFVQVNHGEWDLHGGGLNLKETLPRLCGETTRGAAALVQDLKQRGMLDSTLVIWGAEFGRTPMLQGEDGPNVGRDHHKAFTIWMAGGGVKRAFELGETDDIGYRATRDPVHVHDLQATILHLLGIDHKRLTFRFQGRDYRLTDVHGEVIRKIFD